MFIVDRTRQFLFNITDKKDNLVQVGRMMKLNENSILIFFK